MLGAQGDLALDAHFPQCQVDMAQTAAAAGNVDVGQRQVIIQGEFLFTRQRMPLAHGAHVAVFHQLDVTHLRVGVERRIHREIQAPGRQFLGGFAAFGQETLDDHRRRQAAQALEQWRQDHRFGEVGHADAVGLDRLQRVEDAAFLHRHPQQGEGVTHGADDVLRHRRRHHALGGAHEKRVVEGFAQAGQSVRHRRLSNADDLPGAGQVGFGVDRVEDDEKVEVSQIDVSLAETRLAQDRTLFPPLAQQRDSARHALSILTGKGPADWIAPDFTLAEFALPANVPVSLPSEMAHDRPDVRQAEAELHMASAAVGVATANLYPHVELSASLAQAASGNGGAALWGFAAGLTAPIFNGGTLKAERQAAVDGYKATLAGYQQTVISSFGQVADTLQAINHDAEENLAQEDALRAAETSFRLNQQAYAQGENSILQVLEAERAYEQALLGQIRVKTAQYLDTVRLYVALGGNSVGVFEQRVASREDQKPSYQ